MAIYVVTAGLEQALIANYESLEAAMAAFRELCPNTPVDRVETYATGAVFFREIRAE